MKNLLTQVKTNDLEKIKQDLELIKKALFSEQELSNWAKEELEKSRNEKETTSHEDLKRELGL